MRDFKVTYETMPSRHVSCRYSSTVTAESKQEAVCIAVPDNCKLISARLMPMKKAKKQFDISRHEWSDDDVSYVSNNGYTINLDVNDCGICHGLYLNKNDIIAAAKFLKLTAKDFK